MRKGSELSLDIALSLLGVVLLIIVKNSTRFMGIGLISLGITYFLCDRYTIQHRRSLTNRYGKEI